MTYNSPFQDRAAQAAKARQKALDQLRARPPVDEKVAAERLAAGQARDAAKVQKAAAKRADRKAAAEASTADAAARAAAAPLDVRKHDRSCDNCGGGHGRCNHVGLSGMPA
jgi:hypothetical protein